MSKLSVVIEHVKHRGPFLDNGDVWWYTRCGVRFIAETESTTNTRHHQPPTSRCPKCYSGI